MDKTAKLPRVALSILFVLLLCLPATLQASFVPVYYKFPAADQEFDRVASELALHEYKRCVTAADRARTSVLDSLARRSRNPQLRGRAIFWRIRLNQINAAPDSCLTLLERARTLVGSDKDYDLACINYQLAGNYERTGNYFAAYELLQKAIPVFEKYRDNYFLGHAHLLMGLLYSSIAEPELSIAEIRTAGKYYKAAGYPLNRIYYFEASEEKNINKAIALYKRSIREGADDPGMTVQAYINIADLLIGAGRPHDAIEYIREGRRMLDEKMPDNPPLGSLLYMTEGSAWLKLDNPQQAIELLKKAESLMSGFSQEFWLRDIYRLSYKAYERLGNKEKAFEYLDKYTTQLEAQQAELMRQEIPKARARDAISHQQALIAEMEHQQQIQRDRYVIILLVIGFLLIGTAGFLIYMMQRAKMRKLENQKLKSDLEQQMAITRLNRQNFERDLQQKECEISSSVLLLSNKNEVLQQISDITNRYADAGRIPPDYVEKINKAVGNSLKGDDEWSRFKLHFDSVHPSFFTKLKEKSEELTENDLRLCAYIHIGMRSKEIAAMLAVSAASINSNRYRLRRKLGLSKDDNLDDFLRNV